MKSLIETLLRNPSGKIWVQLFRYLVSGGVAFLVDTGILVLLTWLFGVDLLLLWTGIGFSAGLLVTYLFSILWVFDNRSMSSRTAEILIFILIGVTGLLWTEFFMWLFARQIGVHYVISKVITTVIVFVWNFVLKKILLFRSK